MTCSPVQYTICIIVINNPHMVNKLIDGVSYLKAKFQTDELDQKLNEAVSEENWQASTQLLHEIANASYNYEKEQRILTFLWEKLKHKSWKKVLKTLHLVDFLLKYGPSSLINALRENIYQFRNFDSYTLVADGIDRGESIRKQSRVVVGLLSDDQLLSDERAKAKQIKDRMANVIGSAAYYGSYSNDAPTTSKKETYGSFTASNFNKAPAPYGGGSNGQQGTSFGESVMRSLQQARKAEERIETPPQPQLEKSAKNKLDLSKMNERRPEDQRKTNNLATKLVKPPEKKPANKKVEQPTPPITAVSSKPQQLSSKSQQPQGKVDIMDIDFLSFDNAQPPKAEKPTNDDFDLLGGLASTPPLKTVQSSPPLQKQTDINSLNFGLLHSDPPANPQHQIPITSQQAPNFLYNNANNNFTGFNYQPPTNPTPNFSFNQPPTLPPQTISISLSTPEPKSSTSSTNNSLIDFSNFRQELTQLSHQQQNKSTLQWNW